MELQSRRVRVGLQLSNCFPDGLLLLFGKFRQCLNERYSDKEFHEAPCAMCNCAANQNGGGHALFEHKFKHNLQAPAILPVRRRARPRFAKRKRVAALDRMGSEGEQQTRANWPREANVRHGCFHSGFIACRTKMMAPSLPRSPGQGGLGSKRPALACRFFTSGRFRK